MTDTMIGLDLRCRAGAPLGFALRVSADLRRIEAFDEGSADTHGTRETPSPFTMSPSYANSDAHVRIAATVMLELTPGELELRPQVRGRC